jgi:hypothetical protein
MQLYIVAYLSFFENQIHTAMIVADDDFEAGLKFLADRGHLEISKKTYPSEDYEETVNGLDQYLGNMDATITVQYFQDA